MKTTLISNTKKENGFIYKKYKVELNGKSGIICFGNDDWGIRFEPYDGNFNDKEFESIVEALWNDAVFIDRPVEMI